MPLEWTGHHRFPVCVPKSLPATQGQRSNDSLDDSASYGYALDKICSRQMKSIVSACIIIFAPVTAFAQSGFWEDWNKYSANFSYGPSTTYVNMQSKIVVSSSPAIYSFDARLVEEGSSPEEVYKLLVSCTSKSIMDLSQYSSKKWVKASGKCTRLVVDACR